MRSGPLEVMPLNGDEARSRGRALHLFLGSSLSVSQAIVSSLKCKLLTRSTLDRYGHRREYAAADPHALSFHRMPRSVLSFISSNVIAKCSFRLLDL